jgi:hypothetical protein
LLCTMFNGSHFCFCIWLLESVLAAADAHALKGYRDTPKIQLQKKRFLLDRTVTTLKPKQIM